MYMYMYIPPYGFSTETVDLRLELVQCYVEVSCCIACLKKGYSCLGGGGALQIWKDVFMEPCDPYRPQS